MGLQLKLFAFLLLSSMAFGQQLTPKPSQYASLMKQRKAIVALSDKIEQLRADVAFKISLMEESCRKVVLENHWPTNTICDKNSLIFSVPAPPAPSTVREKPPNGVDMYEQSQKKEPKQ